MARAALSAALLALACSAAQAHTAIVYARADAPRAEAVRSLAGIYSPVLIDRAIPPGAPWRQALAVGICSADVVLVLWSTRAAASPEVAAEWRLAAACAPRVVPVLLDDAPLPPELAARQAIDWR